MFSILDNLDHFALVSSWGEYITTDGKFWSTAELFHWVNANTEHDDNGIASRTYIYGMGQTRMGDIVYQLHLEFARVDIGSSRGIHVKILEFDTIKPIITVDDLLDYLEDPDTEERCIMYWQNEEEKNFHILRENVSKWLVANDVSEREYSPLDSCFV